MPIMPTNILEGFVPLDPTAPKPEPIDGGPHNTVGVFPGLHIAPPAKPSVLTDQMNQVKQRQQQDFVGTMQTVSKVNPDQYAKATQIERWSGVPAYVLHKHQERADEILAAHKYENIYKDYAKTARALADGNVAALAHDDIDSITRIEDAIEAAKEGRLGIGEKVANWLTSGWLGRDQGLKLDHADQMQSMRSNYDKIDAEIARASAAGEQPFADGSVPGQGFGFDYLSATPEGKAAIRANLDNVQQSDVQDIATSEKTLAGMPADPADIRARQLEKSGLSSAEARLQARMENPSSLIRLGVSSLPAMTDRLVGGAIGGIPGAAVGEFGTEYGGKLLDIFRESGVKLDDPRAVMQLLQDDAAMEDARGRAARKAAATTAVDTLSFGIASKVLAPLKIAGKPLSAASREGINIVAQVVPQGILGATSEAVGQYAADGKINGGDVLDEGLAEGVFSFPEILVFGGKRIRTSLADGLRKSRNAKTGKAALDQMVEAVEGGKLKGRDIDTFKKVTGALFKGSEFETVWIPAAKLQELNQSGIAILPEILNQVPGLGEQFADAIVRGGSVQMKTSDYFAHFGGFHDQLGDFVRVQADGMSVDDIKGWKDEQVAQLEMMAQSMREAADPKSVVYQDAMGQLLAAGLQQQDAAQVAGLLTAMITKMSQRTGLTIEELMARDPLNIRKQAPEQLKKIPVTDLGLMLDRLRTGDIPKPGDMFGKSLMEQLVSDGGLQDAGGELAALDADVGKVGRNRITRPDGKTLDDAAMWAWERGYFPGVERKDVGPDLIVNALRDEMAGKPVYSVANENQTLRDQADSLNQLQDHLDQLGIDISQLDNAQVAELLNKPQGEQSYSQDGIEISVDDDGETIYSMTAHVSVGDNHAFVTAEANPDGTYSITESGVPQEMRGNGIGGGLYVALIDAAIGKGADAVYSDNSVSADAQRVYKSLERKGYSVELMDGAELDPDTGALESDSAVYKITRKTGAKTTLNQSATAERNLMAVHNLSADNLLFADKMGGIAVPSIGVVTKDAGGVDGFGEITLIGNRGLADPKQEPVFSADAYTVRFPRPEYGKAKSKPADKLTDDLRPFADEFGDKNIVSETFHYMVNTADASRAVEMWMRSAATKAMFLRGIGVDVKPVMRRKSGTSGLTPEELAEIKPLYEAVDDNLPSGDLIKSDAFIALGEKFKELTETENYGYAVYDRIGNDFRDAGKQEVDRYKTEDGINKALEGREAAFKKWVDDSVLPLFGEPFLKVGSKKLPYTLDNIVKVMTKGPVRVQEKTMTFGAGQARAASAIEFSDVEQMRQAAKDSVVDPAEYEQAKAVSSKLLEQFRDAAVPFTTYMDWRGHPDTFEALDSAMRAVAKFSTKAKRDKAAMKAALKSEGFEVAKMPDEIFDQGILAAEALLNAPVPYFEAKPQRAVSLSEFSGAVIPKDLPAEARAVLENAGLPLIEYSGEGSRLEAVRNAAQQLDDKSGNVLFQPYGGVGSPDDNRGSISFGDRKDGVREFNISLGPKSDLSTVLHELGHYYLEVIGGLVTDGKANAELATDYAAIRKWLGADEGKPLTVDQHEQFARGFEKYLAEGKAPSIELQGAFARFKRWMVAIYKDLARLNVELNDEVRAVFDRLLASQEEIDAAMQVNQAVPMFESATKAGMTEAEWSAYQNNLAAMRDDAEADIERQIMAEEERRQSKWWNEQLARIRKEVGEEVDLVPTFKAMKALRSGKLEGVGATFKLQSGEVNERYGKRVLQRLAFMHAKQGGIPMDIAASMLGFKSGDEMIKAILESPSRAAAIEQEAQQRMQERHGNKVTGEAADAAMAAVHNERRADVLRIELEALAKQGSRKRVTSQQILKEAAKRIMQQRKVREIAPHEYQRAEAKAGREAFTAAAKGDLEAAYEAKQRQLLNFHLYREAVKAREQVGKITERMKGYNKTSRRQKIGKAGHDYLDQIDAVMEQYEFRTVSLRELDKRVSFGQWYNDQVAAGNDPYVPEFIINSMGKTNYKDLTLDQLQELDEFTRHVEHMARTKNKLLANDRIASKEEAANMLVDGALANMGVLGRELIDKNARDVSEETRDYLREGNSSLMKAEQVITWLDGNKIDGNWTQVFWRPLAEAQHKRDDMNRAVTQKVNAAIKAWFDTLGKDAGKTIHIKSTNQPMTRNGVLAVALNQGNAGNKAKLLKGYGWDQSVVDEILGHMTKEDWQLVNDLWEIVGSLWPEIAAMEKQANGIAPPAVEHTPVETPFGVLSGGYWPLVYDTMSDAYANVLKDMGTLAPLSEQGQARASTPRGHTKARVDGFAAPIVLDVSIIGHHLAGVIHDLTHRLPLADARALLTTPSVVSALNKTIGKPMTAQFRNMVDGIAADLAPGSQRGIGVIQRGMNILRSNQAVAWMGYSVTTALNQLGGYAQAAEYFAQLGARKHYLKALAKFAANPIEQMEMARAMSGEMRNRDINLDQTLREATNQLIQVKDGHLILDAWKSVKGGRDALVKYSFVPLQYMQRMVDVPVWMAAYELEGGALNHDLAVQAADKAVRLTQMAGGAKDLAAVQHSDLLRFFLPVYGYASLLWNRNVDVARAGVQGIKQRSAKQVLVAFERFIYLNILPSLLSDAIRGALPDDDDDDDETWAAWFVVKLLLSVTNGVPLLRDVAAGAFSDFGYGGASQIGAGFGNLLKAANASKAESITTNMVSAAGQLFGLPASQINRAVRTGFALEDGEMEDSATAIVHGILLGPPRD